MDTPFGREGGRPFGPKVMAAFGGGLCRRVVFASLKGKVAASPQFIASFLRKEVSPLGDGG
jgi:hypothetical protein